MLVLHLTVVVFYILSYSKYERVYSYIIIIILIIYLRWKIITSYIYFFYIF